ncbi:MAG: hypothetical protein WAN86_14080 [Hyphomicrobiaceae bacterium]
MSVRRGAIRDPVEAMIIQRIVPPGSKLAFHRALVPEATTSGLALSLGLAGERNGSSDPALLTEPQL